jgi:hypothetical protein
MHYPAPSESVTPQSSLFSRAANCEGDIAVSRLLSVEALAPLASVMLSNFLSIFRAVTPNAPIGS